MSTPTPTPTPAAGAAPASGAAPAKKMKRVKMTKVVNGVDTEVEVEVEDTGDGPTWGARKDHTLVNTRLERIDAPVKVTGAAKYTHDIRLPGMLYARVLRCPHPHAKVKGIDFSAADAIPGVK